MNSTIIVLNDNSTFTDAKGCRLLRVPDGWTTDAIECHLADILDGLEPKGAHVVGMFDAYGKLCSPDKSQDPFTIYATAHTDDRVIYVEFDALNWFKQASCAEIVELARCGWGGDYPADYVAIWMADRDPDTARIFDHTASHEPCGFECYVNGKQALAWLKKNRLHVYRSVVSDKEVIRGGHEKG